MDRFCWPCSRNMSRYLNSHVSVCEDHVEVIMRHAELLPQLCDQILVHQVLLTKTLHGFIIL